MNQKMFKDKNNQGFTLLELVIAMLISGIVLGAVYRTYRFQQKSYVVQDQVSVMQQNLRAAMYHMATDLRMAGYDPHGSAGAGFVPPLSAATLRFTLDLDEDGTISGGNEDITYTLNVATGDLLRNGNVIAEAPRKSIVSGESGTITYSFFSHSC